LIRRPKRPETGETEETGRCYFLFHHIPSQPVYMRVRISGFEDSLNDKNEILLTLSVDKLNRKTGSKLRLKK
jgi:hypothetical protein